MKNNIDELLINRKTKMAIIGMGYVGMPMAVAFSKIVDVIGYDLNKEKIELYKNGIDPTKEVGSRAIERSRIEFTFDEEKLDEAKFYIITVPTPIKTDKSPDLFAVKEASRTIGRHLKKGDFVVYESTVYPGVTEDICIPILEKESDLSHKRDFQVGYSPERINPGDKTHRLQNIIKIVAGMDDESTDEIAKVYELIIQAGIHKVSSIKVAEAAKVVENSQRDINIAFMNEMAIVFERMGINTNEVIEAMNTKWNALGFYPGLVGGHCISVDPYYFIYQAANLGYHSQIVAAGRKVNDDMSRFVANNIIKKLVLSNKIVTKSKIAILGVTFKENCPDIRNSKVFNIINILKEYDVIPLVLDMHADKDEVARKYRINLVDFSDVNQIDCLVLAVAHEEFREMNWEQIDAMFEKGSKKIIFDIKGILSADEARKKGYTYWSL